MKITKKIVSVFLAVIMVLSVFSVSLTAFAATKKVTKITISKTSATVYTTKTLALTAKVTPSDASNKKVIWSSSDKSVATVSSSGVVKGVKAGKATITVKAADGSGKTATCKVTVKKFVKISSLKMNSASKALDIGKTVTLKAAVSPSNASITTYKWTSSNKKVATVDSNGVVKGVKAGTATITAATTDGSNKKVTCKVTVSKFVTGIKLSKTSASLYPKKTVTLTATVSPSDATTKAVKWSSSNTNIATVDSKGVVTAVKAGTATITATAADASGKTATCKVTVKTYVTGVKLDKTSATVYPGKSLALNATVSPSGASNKTLKWTSSNTSAATVDSEGVVKGVTAGKTATITATATDGSGKKATCTITVGVPVKELKITTSSGSNAAWYVGKTEKLVLNVTPTNATNKKATWKSSEPECVTVDANGTVKVIANTKKVKGFLGFVSTEKVTKAVITATAADGSGKSATYTINITDLVPVTGVKFASAVKSEIIPGETASYKVVVEPSNAAEKEIIYTISDSSVATIDENGNVKGLKTGSVTITATSKYDSSKKIAKTIKVVPVTIDYKVSGGKKVFYGVGEEAEILFLDTPSDAFNILGVQYYSSSERVAAVNSNTGANSASAGRYCKVTFKNPGSTKVYAITKGGAAISEMIDFEVRELRVSKNFFQNAKKGSSFIIDAYLYNGTKIPATDDFSEVVPVLGAYDKYFDVAKNSEGRYVITVKEDLPDNGAYVMFKAKYAEADVSAKVFFLKNEYNAPSNTDSLTNLYAKFKGYSKTASALTSAEGVKTVSYSDVVVNNNKSTTDIHVKAPITFNQWASLDEFIKLLGAISGDDANELMAEMSADAVVKELFSEVERTEIAAVKSTYPKEIATDISDVKSITVTNDPTSLTYKMTLVLNDQPSAVSLDSVNTSAYGKAMAVIDKPFMDEYAKTMNVESFGGEFGDDAAISLSYGTVKQKYSNGYIIYTIDKFTEKVVASEYHFKSNVNVDKAMFDLKATIPDTPIGKLSIHIAINAYFNMNAERTTSYSNFKY